IGVTTAAAIWTVAAIGVVLGTGYVAAGAFFTILTLVTLTLERWCEKFIYGPCHWVNVHVEYDPAGGRTRPQIQGILDDNGVNDPRVRFIEPAEGTEAVEICCCLAHRHHRNVLSPLAALPVVRRFEFAPAPPPAR